MDTNQIMLAVIAAVLVVFSLTVALVVPRRNPDFPARKMGLFFGVSMVLVAGMLLTVVYFGEDDAEDLHAAAPAETGGAEGEGAGEAPPGTGGAETGAPAEPSAPAGDPAAGKEVFLSPEAGCGNCHTLADAGTSGTVGPNLDDAAPSYELAVERVTNGAGAMPPFQGVLSEQQIQDVAAYVVQATSG